MIALVSCNAAESQNCTVTQNDDGSATIFCDDGTEATVNKGDTGNSCTVADNPDDDTYLVSCDDGTEILLHDGDDGDNCTVRDEGTYLVISCPDGTEIEVPKPNIDPTETTLHGSFVVRNSQDIEYLKNYKVITGDLIFETNGMTVITLPNLERIEGELCFDGESTVTIINFPSLIQVHYFHISYMQLLTSISIPNITHIDTIRITDNTMLPQCGLDIIFGINGINVGATDAVIFGNDENATCTP